MPELKHWQMEKDGDGVVWLGMDNADGSANVLSAATLGELKSILDDLANDKPNGLIIFSLKESGFIAGADVKEFTKIKDEIEALDLIEKGQGVMDAIEAAGYPTCAMIHGFCLGGGTELALACDYRVASDDPKTKIGLPEVLLGIHPGFGGSVRLPRVINALDAMGMMLTGKPANARAAKKTGLVDHAVPLRHLKIAAKDIVTKRPPLQTPKGIKKFANSQFVRPWLAKVFEKRVRAKASKEHYPAPYALIDLWIDHFDDKRSMMRQEALSVAKLITNDTAKNLVRVFFLQERMKGLGGKSDYKPERIHVIGAGIMGGDIASWLAYRGFIVTLQDTEPSRIAPAIKRANALFKKRLKQPRLIQAAMDRLMPDVDGVGVASADVVIEAIFEDLEVKRKLYAEIEPKLKEGAILATNTSSIRLEELSVSLERPGRLIGLHFFNPVAMMKLVEVVKGAATDEDTLNRSLAFVKAMDKLPVVVKSSPGFLVNRILMPYLMEAMDMVTEGVPITEIDKAATDFGMPMGPVTLGDAVGLEILLSVAKIMTNGDDADVPPKLKELVEAGKLGKKTGSGFYEYKKGKQVMPKESKGYIASPDLADRMILRFANEAVACMREGVVDEDDFLDAGVIFGTGFAPFRGGPMNYLKSRGVENVFNRLKELEGRYGERFAPDKGFQTMMNQEGE